MEIVPPNVNLQLSLLPRDSISRGTLTVSIYSILSTHAQSFPSLNLKEIRLDNNGCGFSRLRFLGWEAENQFEEVF